MQGGYYIGQPYRRRDRIDKRTGSVSRARGPRRRSARRPRRRIGTRLHESCTKGTIDPVAERALKRLEMLQAEREEAEKAEREEAEKTERKEAEKTERYTAAQVVHEGVQESPVAALAGAETDREVAGGARGGR